MIGVAFDAGVVCIHILFIRHGKVLGSRSYFSKVPDGTDLSEVVQTFIEQYYLQVNHIRTLPYEILLDFMLPDKESLSELLSNKMGQKVNIQTNPRGNRAHYLKLASTNAATALITKLSQQSIIHQRLTTLAEILGIVAVNRMECFDISHMMGEQIIASCAVFDSNGPVYTEYRRYNICGITPGDDYAAMNQVLRRRYGKALEKNKIPEVVIIDGGKGQLNIAKTVFSELNVSWDTYIVILLAVTKGADRKVSQETLFLKPYGEGITLLSDSPALHIIQHIRNNAHNYAITGHGNKLAKIKNTSVLELINGISPRRRQALLKYMGGFQSLRNASIEDITQVPGISYALAEKIFNTLKH